MLIILSLLSVTCCIYLAIASHSCHRMKSVHNVKANLTKCEMKTFSKPVPAYFCVEYCESLCDCWAVTMAMGEMTSWCCAFSATKSDLTICHGNHTILNLAVIELSWQSDNSCSGEVIWS